MRKSPFKPPPRSLSPSSTFDGSDMVFGLAGHSLPIVQKVQKKKKKVSIHDEHNNHYFICPL